MTTEFPSPTDPAASTAEVLDRYLRYFRARLVDKITELPEAERRASRLASGWTPLGLLKHLTFVELRWLQWGFEGQDIAQPWGDQRDGVWHVGAAESFADLVAALTAQAQRSSAIIARHELTEIGRPGPRWDGAEPATLERVLLHLVQEYARHVGHLDIVAELVAGSTGE